jgi:hypothetical protein
MLQRRMRHGPSTAEVDQLPTYVVERFNAAYKDTQLVKVLQVAPQIADLVRRKGLSSSCEVFDDGSHRKATMDFEAVPAVRAVQPVILLGFKFVLASPLEFNSESLSFLEAFWVIKASCSGVRRR